VSGTLHTGGTLGAIILGAIRRFEDEPALSDGTTSWTYRELGDAIARCIAVFRSLGLAKGDGMAILAGNRAEQVAAQYAALLMGVRFTALHLLSARATHDFIIDDAEIVLLLVDPALPDAGDFRAGHPALRHVLSLGPSAQGIDLIAAMAAAAPAPLSDDADPEAIALLFYTGGTTGQPKGVKLVHRCVVTATMIQACDWDLGAGPLRFLAATPTSHASGIILPTIFMGGGYVRLTRGFDPAEFCRLVEGERIGCTFLVPTMLYVLLDSPARAGFDLSSLTTVVYGAAPMAEARIRAALVEFGPIFVQLYGQTEAPMCITTLRKRDHLDPCRLTGAGLACPGVQVRLFDPDMHEVEAGEPGELCVRAPLVMDGYWHRDEATDEAWRGGWHHTGDVAVRDADGYLRLVDRTSDLIISGGFNIYPREVEEALLAHPDLSAAAVVGLPDAKWGEAVTAFVVLREGREPGRDELKAHVRDRRGPLAAPKRIVILDQLPLTPLGKVDRKALKALVDE